MSALPAVFLTDKLHVVPAQVMQNNPSHLKLTKVFWTEHVDAIRTEFNAVKLLGHAAAEEWIKGLENRGKQITADASRWEKWSLSGGVRRMKFASATANTDVFNDESLGQASIDPKDDSPHTKTPAKHINGAEQLADCNDLHGMTKASRRTDVVTSQTRPQGQHKRTKGEVAALRAERRAEIERRSLLLEPPLLPHVLAQLASFQAALQITAPLEDHAWELLKPRLLAQREEAEKREEENSSNARTLQARLEASREDSVAKKQASREATDQDWDDIQGPVRGRISVYADEIIRKNWENGAKVSRKTSARFAAEVLVYAREKFYAQVAKDVVAALAAGKQPDVDPVAGPWTQKLTLENMKWVFDTKIKPHTEPFRKELFLCNGCPTNLKYYGFEGVVQHYAAKHTSSLSKGSMVVHWRAEWPEKPPFNPEPRGIVASTPELPRYNDVSSYPNFGFEHQHPHLGTFPAYPIAPHEAPFNHPYGHGYQGHQTIYPVASPCGAGNVPAYGGSQPSFGHAHDNTYHTHYPATPQQNGEQTGYYSIPEIPPPSVSYNEMVPYAGSHSNPQDCSHDARLHAMAGIAKATWDKLVNIQNLPNSTKLCTVIHHIAKSFQRDFSEAASLPMFIYGLSHHKDMQLIRNASKLACKICATRTEFTAARMNFSSIGLANHFQREHVEVPEAQGTQPLDWRIDMVQLPDIRNLMGLHSVLGGYRAAYNLVADTLPWAFAHKSQAAAVEVQEGENDLRVHNMTFDDGNSTRDSHNSPQRCEPISEPTRLDQIESEPSRVQTPSQKSQPQDDRSSNRPNLRPASVVYGRTATPLEYPSTLDPRSAQASEYYCVDRRPWSGQSGRRPSSSREAPVRHPGDMNGLGQHARIQHISAQAEDRYDRYSERARRQSSRGPLQHNTRSPRTQWEGEPRYSERPSRSMAPDRRSRRSRDRDPAPLDAFEPHIDERQRQPSGRYGSLADGYERRYPEEYPPPGAGPVYYDTPPPPSSRYRLRSRSPRGDERASAYRTRSPRRGYSPLPLRSEFERPPRMYYDDPRANPGPIVDAYELVEVRDPRGDYYIRRPIHPSERDYPVYQDERRLWDRPQYPPRRSVDAHRETRPTSQATDHRGANVVPTPAGAAAGYEDYDPRYPTAGRPPAE